MKYNRSEFLLSVRSYQPASYILRHREILYFADLHFPEPASTIPTLYDRASFSEPDILTEWVSSFLVG